MGFLQVKGEYIVDDTGKKVFLRGVCFGGWLNMENFITGYPGAESNVRQAIKDELGEERYQVFFTSLLDSFITEGDFKFLSKIGSTVVRIPQDIEIVWYITENILQDKIIHSPQEDFQGFYKQQINFWYRMGYDYIRVSGGLNFPKQKRRVTEDTALLSRGERNWIEETVGVISFWKDFEEYQWPTSESFNFSSYEFVSKNIPEGMKMMVCPSSGVFEISSETLLGFEGIL